MGDALSILLVIEKGLKVTLPAPAPVAWVDRAFQQQK